MSVDLSRLHGVLKDKTRASILEVLGQRGDLSYTELQRSLGIEHTGKLNYHLKVLGDLLTKDEATGRYSLSEKGKIAALLLGNFQAETGKRPDGVLVLGALMVIVGLAELYTGLPAVSRFIGVLKGVAPSTAETTFVAFLVGASVAYVALDISYVGLGVGLVYSRRWAWPGTIAAFAAAASLLAAESLFFTTEVLVNDKLTFNEGLQVASGFAYVFVPELVLIGVALYYLTRPRVKTYFGRGIPVAAPSASVTESRTSPAR